MPVKEIALGKLRSREGRQQELYAALVAEWKSMSSNEKLLIVEETRAGQVMHVYVVWDDWQELDHHARSEIITDAFLEVKDEGAITNLAVAMGVTWAEAKRMRLPLE